MIRFARFLFSISAVIALSIYSISPAPAGVLSDTGQTTCYDEYFSPTLCPAPGNAMAQDGSYVGSQPHFHDNGNETVTDLNTNLVWQKADDGTPKAWGDAGPYCAGLELAGKDDWRLPTIKELNLLVNAATNGPTYFSAFSCQSSEYWSSTASVSSGTSAWRVNFNTRDVLPRAKTDEYYVRCVRGDPLPDANIAGNGDGTATDSTTGLMWQEDGTAAGQRVWHLALKYCEEECNQGGHTDWRMPDRNELVSSVNFAASNPATYGVLTTASSFYWTSSTAPGNRAWGVWFSSGGMTGLVGKSVPRDVRCVRGGLWATPDPSASLTGAPSGTTSETDATITVGGSNVAKYRYRLDSGAYSSETDIATDISLSGLPEGSHTLYVLGVNSAGKLQTADTTATWTVGSAGSLTVSSSPANAATSVARDTTVVFTFSMEMETSTVDLSISPIQAADYTKSWSSDKKTLTVTFKQNLAGSTKYTVEIPVTAKAADGTALASKFEASFTTKEATGDEKTAEIGGAPTRPEVEAMLNRGGVSTSSVSAMASEGILLVPDAIAQTGAKGAATGSDADKMEACAEAESFCMIVADGNMAAGFDPANTVASVKGLQANATSSTSGSPKIMTLYTTGYLPEGSIFFPQCFKANEATASVLEFTYVNELTAAKIKAAADGDDKAGFAMINPATGAIIQPGENLPDLSGGYGLMLFIRDNSLYDTNSAWGTVEDPSYLTSGQASADTGSSGCMLNPVAGFGLEWLMVMCFPFLAALRSRFRK